MSHSYPIAKTARDAVLKAEKAARTRGEAQAASDGATIKALETEWLTPKAKDIPGLLKSADSGPGEGFLQHYEDAGGNPVLAVTYWKLVAKKAAALKPEPKAKVREDHTDDLYFKHRGSKRKALPADPNQLDMFSADKKKS